MSRDLARSVRVLPRDRAFSSALCISRYSGSRFISATDIAVFGRDWKNRTMASSRRTRPAPDDDDDRARRRIGEVLLEDLLVGRREVFGPPALLPVRPGLLVGAGFALGHADDEGPPGFEEEGRGPGRVDDVPPFGLVEAHAGQAELAARRGGQDAREVPDELLGLVVVLAEKKIAGEERLLAERAGRRPGHPRTPPGC